MQYEKDNTIDVSEEDEDNTHRQYIDIPYNGIPENLDPEDLYIDPGYTIPSSAEGQNNILYHSE